MEKKPTKKVTAAQKRATAKYNAKAYDRIELKVSKGKKQIIQNVAKERGESLNAFINRAIDTELERIGECADAPGEVME